MEARSSSPSIFLSHSHRDREAARRIAEDLTRRGARVWIDEAALYVGDSLSDKISQALSDVDYIAFLFSSRSVRSTWVSVELRLAMEGRSGENLAAIRSTISSMAAWAVI